MKNIDPENGRLNVAQVSDYFLGTEPAVQQGLRLRTGNLRGKREKRVQDF